MHARVVSIQVRAGDLPEVGRIYREAVLPVCKGQQGYRGALLLTDGDTGRAVSITLWESEPDMRAGENSALFQSQSERVQQLLTAPAERTYFRVDTLNLP
jgi:heme-degrading monooxygenase HmoA